MGKLLSILHLVALVAITMLGVGWVMNIFYLFGYNGEITGSIALRIIGIFVVPIGGVLGWI